MLNLPEKDEVGYGPSNILFSEFILFCFSDPPLEESDIPAGQWLCHRCRIRERRVSYHSILTLTTYPLPFYPKPVDSDLHPIPAPARLFSSVTYFTHCWSLELTT